MRPEEVQPRSRWFGKLRYRILLTFVIALLALSALQFLFPPPPKSPERVYLDGTVGYFFKNYNYTTGLIPETPRSSTYWLYSDNYLVDLALYRYPGNNQSTGQFAVALKTALDAYSATAPISLLASQYTALNSTRASFSCSSDHTLQWSLGNTSSAGASEATMKTTANDGNQACAAENYADILFLEALEAHRMGNQTAAGAYYHQASSDFDGIGINDLAFTTDGSQSFGIYQTYKVALYLYVSSCLGLQHSDAAYPSLEGVLLSQRDPSTGGFYTGYHSLSDHASSGPNTETTALAALAFEELIGPLTEC